MIFTYSLFGERFFPKRFRVLFLDDEFQERLVINVPILSYSPTMNFAVPAQTRDIVTSEIRRNSRVAGGDIPHASEEYIVAHARARATEITLVMSLGK